MSLLGTVFKIALGVGATVLAVAAVKKVVDYLSSKKIQEELNEKNLAMAVVEKMEKGNYNKVTVGLYNDNGERKEAIEYHAKEVDGLHEGMEIYA